MFGTLLAKEVRELWRTWKAIIFLAIFLITGMISPVLARYTPELLKAIPNIPAGLADFIPAPTVADAVTQYIKNIGQFGILLVLILTMGVVAQEKERGTAAMLLTKPIGRSAVILSKWLVGMGLILAGLLAGGFGCLAYTAVLFEPLPFGAFWTLNLLLAIYLGVYLSLALLASALARNQTVAAGGAFGGLVVLLILGSIPNFGDYTPGKLSNWGSSLVLGGTVSAWSALGIAIGLIVLMVLFACLHFEREEI
jgi:ABC-2 type transport system permease protein